MSKLDNFRRMYSLYDCEEGEVIDAVLETISKQEQSEEERFELKKGREVHRITLTKSAPATVMKAELNLKLDKDVRLTNFNVLDGTDHQSPGSWFVDRGFIVRSKKENGYWVQYAFKDSGADNLTRSEVMGYLDIAKLDYDKNIIAEFGPTTITRK